MLRYITSEEAEAVAKAVSPDNYKAPPGLIVETRREGHVVFTRVKCSRGVESFLATLDDLLSSVQLAERTISVVRGASER